jgi:exosome complex component RRP42
MTTSRLTIETLNKMFAENKRFDGRKLLDFRDISIKLDISNKAEGSAGIKIGKTEVLVGVKLGIGVPYPDSPNKGYLTVSADLLPKFTVTLSTPRF